jgi:hypothetical protein
VQCYHEETEGTGEAGEHDLQAAYQAFNSWLAQQPQEEKDGVRRVDRHQFHEWYWAPSREVERWEGEVRLQPPPSPPVTWRAVLRYIAEWAKANQLVRLGDRFPDHSHRSERYGPYYDFNRDEMELINSHAQVV